MSCEKETQRDRSVGRSVGRSCCVVSCHVRGVIESRQSCSDSREEATGRPLTGRTLDEMKKKKKKKKEKGQGH